MIGKTGTFTNTNGQTIAALVVGENAYAKTIDAMVWLPTTRGDAVGYEYPIWRDVPVEQFVERA